MFEMLRQRGSSGSSVSYAHSPVPQLKALPHVDKTSRLNSGIKVKQRREKGSPVHFVVWLAAARQGPDRTRRACEATGRSRTQQLAVSVVLSEHCSIRESSTVELQLSLWPLAQPNA